MIRLIVASLIMGLIAFGSAISTAGAMEGAQSLAPASSAKSTIAIKASSTLPYLRGLLGDQKPLLEPAQYSCRRICKQCRRDCVADWKWDCYGHRCRRGFTRCMRHCWNDICRDCG